MLDLAHDGVAAADEYGSATTFTATRPIEKLDVIAYTGDIYLQFEYPSGWGPPAGVRSNAGIFHSIPGVGGASGVRFKRASAGVAATLDFRTFSE